MRDSQNEANPMVSSSATCFPTEQDQTYQDTDDYWVGLESCEDRVYLNPKQGKKRFGRLVDTGDPWSASRLE